MVISPNPSVAQTRVAFPDSVHGWMDVEVFDMAGKSASRRTIVVKEGEAGFLLDVQDLAPSVYLVRVTSPDFSASERLFIQR